jgi:hypothetical protein
LLSSQAFPAVIVIMAFDGRDGSMPGTTPLKPKQGLNGPPEALCLVNRVAAYQRADDLDDLDLVLVDGVGLSG